MSKPKKSRPIVSITIGDICISDGYMLGSDAKKDTIWLAHRDGEAGSFSRKKLGKVIEKFFNKHF